MPLAEFLIQPAVLAGKLLKNCMRRLAHQREHPVGHMFGRNLELARHMMFHKLVKERGIPVQEEIVEPDA